MHNILLFLEQLSVIERKWKTVWDNLLIDWFISLFEAKLGPHAPVLHLTSLETKVHW